MRRRTWPNFAMLWLTGANLRLTVLAVPPVLPLIPRRRFDVRLSGAAKGGLPGFGRIAPDIILMRHARSR